MMMLCSGKTCVPMCVHSKAPERRFNGCLHQIRKTITKIHIKFIVAPFVRSFSAMTAIFFRYSVCLRSGY